MPRKRPKDGPTDFVAMVDRVFEDFPGEEERKVFLVDGLVKAWNERGRRDAELVDERMSRVVVDVPLEAYRDHLIQAIRGLNR